MGTILLSYGSSQGNIDTPHTGEVVMGRFLVEDTESKYILTVRSIATPDVATPMTSPQGIHKVIVCFLLDAASISLPVILKCFMR